MNYLAIDSEVLCNNFNILVQYINTIDNFNY